MSIWTGSLFRGQWTLGAFLWRPSFFLPSPLLALLFPSAVLQAVYPVEMLFVHILDLNRKHGSFIQSHNRGSIKESSTSSIFHLIHFPFVGRQYVI